MTHTKADTVVNGTVTEGRGHQPNREHAGVLPPQVGIDDTAASNNTHMPYRA
jgi:hypothetical protein